MTKEGTHVLDIAYPIALGSYDVQEKRYSAVEKRLQELLTFGVAISLGIVTLFAGRGYPMDSKLFIVGLVVILFAVVVGVHSRMSGGLILMSPTGFNSNFEQLTKMSDFAIKEALLKSASAHWTMNNQTIKKKHKAISITMGFFLFGIILLACWAATAGPTALASTLQSLQSPCPPAAREPAQAPASAPVAE